MTQITEFTLIIFLHQITVNNNMAVTDPASFVAEDFASGTSSVLDFLLSKFCFLYLYEVHISNSLWWPLTCEFLYFFLLKDCITVNKI